MWAIASVGRICKEARNYPLGVNLEGLYINSGHSDSSIIGLCIREVMFDVDAEVLGDVMTSS